MARYSPRKLHIALYSPGTVGLGHMRRNLLIAQVLAESGLQSVNLLITEGARHQMPMKVYDAMAMAKPIVASAVSDLPTVLDGCGRLVSLGDVGGLAASLRDLLEHPAAARTLGERARARCLEKYSMQAVAAALRKAVDQAKP